MNVSAKRKQSTAQIEKISAGRKINAANNIQALQIALLMP